MVALDNESRHLSLTSAHFQIRQGTLELGHQLVPVGGAKLVKAGGTNFLAGFDQEDNVETEFALGLQYALERCNVGVMLTLVIGDTSAIPTIAGDIEAVTRTGGDTTIPKAALKELQASWQVITTFQ